MRQERSDLWDHHRIPGHLVCISTNGFVKRNGAAVMGRGCALEATRLHPGIQMELGRSIKLRGNVPCTILYDNIALGILPVKHNWWEKADLELIRQSVEWLAEQFVWDNQVGELHPDTIVHVPRLGCGNGGRDWLTEVEPLMRGLPDNVVVHS